MIPCWRLVRAALPGPRPRIVKRIVKYAAGAAPVATRRAGTWLAYACAGTLAVLPPGAAERQPDGAPAPGARSAPGAAADRTRTSSTTDAGGIGSQGGSAGGLAGLPGFVPGILAAAGGGSIPQGHPGLLPLLPILEPVQIPEPASLALLALATFAAAWARRRR